MTFKLVKEQEEFDKIFKLFIEGGLIDDSPNVHSETLELLTWLYHANPNSFHFIQNIDKNIVAHYGGSNISYKLDGVPTTITVASNLVINKNYRNILNFIKLQKELFRIASNNHIKLALGFPSRDGIEDLHLRMGWRNSAELAVYIKPLDIHSMLHKLVANRFCRSCLEFFKKFLTINYDINKRVSINSKISVKRIFQFNEEHNPFFLRWQNNYSICAIRNHKFLNWRFFDNATREYIVYEARKDGIFCGYLALRVMDMKSLKSLAIVDIVCMPKDNDIFRLLLKYAKFTGSIHNVDCIAIALNPKASFQWSNLFLSGYVKSFHKFSVITKNLSPNLNLFLPKNKWFLSWLEHDFV